MSMNNELIDEEIVEIPDFSEGKIVDLTKLSFEKIHPNVSSQHQAECAAAKHAETNKLPAVITVFKNRKSTFETLIVSKKQCGVTFNHPQFVSVIPNSDYCKVRSSKVI